MGLQTEAESFLEEVLECGEGFRDVHGLLDDAVFQARVRLESVRYVWQFDLK